MYNSVYCTRLCTLKPYFESLRFGSKVVIVVFDKMQQSQSEFTELNLLRKVCTSSTRLLSSLFSIVNRAVVELLTFSSLCKLLPCCLKLPLLSVKEGGL